MFIIPAATRRLIGVLAAAVFLSSCVPAPAQTDKAEAEYGAETKNVPLSALRQTSDPTVSALAPQLPFAYYPSRRQLEVAFDRTSALKLLNLPAATQADSLEVRVLPVKGGASVANGTIKLNVGGLAQQIVPLPLLPDGEYAVEYVVAGKTLRSPKTFLAKKFTFEGNALAEEHKVYAPFEPVRVEGAKVHVVGRTYTLNRFGLFDSVLTQGRELLAAPMSLQIEGGANWTGEKIGGKVLHPDLAVFDGSATADAVAVTSRASVEEDGATKVELTLKPGAKPQEIKRMWIEIPLRDAAAPLFHWVADNGMRHNYGGVTPRGGKILWDLDSQIGAPAVWKAEAGTDDGFIWDSNVRKFYRNGMRADMVPFTPYVWLGDETRGLAWFGENQNGYVFDGKAPTQTLERKGDRLTLRVYLIQRPTTLTREHKIVFGLQASPTKPMEANWRKRHVAHGIGPVVAWGGYIPASKYPDNYRWEIADKIQEARRTGKVDTAFFEQADKERAEPNRKVHDRNDWLKVHLLFAQRAAASKNQPAGTYFEEHATDITLPEWQVYQDEWANQEFNRFQPTQGNAGNYPESYRDFALYFANEWLKRGVSLYFDNTNPKRNYNPQFSAAYRDEKGVVRFAVSLWDQRAYYKRVWKLAQSYNQASPGQRAPYPLDVTFHMTSTQMIPFNTWTTATLDLEQRYRKDDAGKPVPWPADYTRTVTMSRTVGSIPMALDELRNGVRHDFTKVNPPHVVLSNWGMHLVHEVAGAEMNDNNAALARRYQKAVDDFGYGTPGVQVQNYWDDKPLVSVTNAQVKWLLLSREQAPQRLLLLQSYAPDALETTLKLNVGKVLRDIESGQTIQADAGGEVRVTLAADYGTRMFWVADAESSLPKVAPAAP